MNPSAEEFIKKARSKGLDDEQIKEKLVKGGWNEAEASEALGDLVVPPPPSKTPAANQPKTQLDHMGSEKPIAVVQNLSVRGFEYSIMFLTLWATAFSVMWLGLSYINGIYSKAGGTYSYGETNTGNTFVITTLLVTFPIFAYLFLRLKRAEFEDPSLRNDASRHKLTQLTELVSFITAIGFTIYFLYSVISPDTLSASDSVVKRLLQVLVALLVAGGVFAYYWRDERKGR